MDERFDLVDDPAPTQQEWLHEAYAAIRRTLLPEAPANVLVSYGFPKGSSGRGSKRIGECWHVAPEGKSAVIFIHPCQWTAPADVLHVLVHEAIHAQHPKAGHAGEFKRTALAVGLEGKMTSTHAGPELARKLAGMARTLQPFPRAAFDPRAIGREKKPGSRLRLWECTCGVKVRVARDDFRATCGECGGPFERR